MHKGRQLECDRHVSCYDKQIIAFSDEEGVRFQTTFLGSQAVAGTFQPHMLDVADKRYYGNVSKDSICSTFAFVNCMHRAMSTKENHIDHKHFSLLL